MKFNDYFLYSSFLLTITIFGCTIRRYFPGSRNTPLIAAFARKYRNTKNILLDERSAAFLH
jgi:2-succinyl-5-enolpyruvyl-6-hydroxy-3-cyclohexene-1-carboxylate synthase